jgi:hypothetical protein
MERVGGGASNQSIVGETVQASMCFSLSSSPMILLRDAALSQHRQEVNYVLRCYYNEHFNKR